MVLSRLLDVCFLTV